jgi:hypothetical protein
MPKNLNHLDLPLLLSKQGPMHKDEFGDDNDSQDTQYLKTKLKNLNAKMDLKDMRQKLMRSDSTTIESKK